MQRFVAGPALQASGAVATDTQHRYATWRPSPCGSSSRPRSGAPPALSGQSEMPR